jgi:hypothetical protein
MSNFTDLAQQKDAAGFQQGVETSLAEKVAAALENKKMEVANRMFNPTTNEGSVDESTQIDEISKGTLKSYIKKAAEDGMQKSYRSGIYTSKNDKNGESTNYKKAIKRLNGIRTAVNKLTKEDIDESNLFESEKPEDYTPAQIHQHVETSFKQNEDIGNKYKQKAEKSKGTRDFHDHMKSHHYMMNSAHENAARTYKWAGMHEDAKKHYEQMIHHAQQEHLHNLHQHHYNDFKEVGLTHQDNK